MYPAGFNKIILVFAFLTIAVFVGGCMSKTHKQNLDSGYIYAESNARLHAGNQQSEIKRKIYIHPSGIKAVISAISNVTDYFGNKTYSMRYLSEYLKNDTLFSFDSGDSTCIAFPVADLSESDIYNFSMSALWLLRNCRNDSGKGEADSIRIAGYKSRKEVVPNGFVFVSEKQPLAVELINNDIIYTERVIRIETDTFFSENKFQMPAGYHLMLPSGK